MSARYRRRKKPHRDGRSSHADRLIVHFDDELGFAQRASRRMWSSSTGGSTPQPGTRTMTDDELKARLAYECPFDCPPGIALRAPATLLAAPESFASCGPLRWRPIRVRWRSLRRRRFGAPRRQGRQDATLSALAHDHDVAAGAVVGTIARRARVPHPAANAHHAVCRSRDRHKVPDGSRDRLSVARQENDQPARDPAHDGHAPPASGRGHQHDPGVARSRLDPHNQCLCGSGSGDEGPDAPCGSFMPGKAASRRWRDDPSLMQFLRSL